MIVAEGVTLIPLHIGGITLNPTLLWDESMAVLIDTGMPGQDKQIIEGMKRVGIPFENLKSVILTHQDIDHIGSLPAKPYIEGGRPLLKMELPEQLQHLLDNPPKVRVDHTLNYGDELPFFAGVRVIFTPGHTPGHISLYLKRDKILIAGDAFYCVDGELRAPTKKTTLDLSAAQKSITKFLDFDIHKVICFHGGLCTDGVNEQLRRLVRHNQVI
ncbi:MBL fold metallo-hydrolase [Paenibacillus wynnii]|uniref:MBL fold metallo-hydrolase n=1 Tax=Paenibacillus wynnii TaxID=268407 RepID=UPI00279312DA|nr:MBL fold metallo-hydrolase [Paenibacillus wynnii]MDQ0195927.1 glyoxylase-like metal-dependent hydrolase (beta-lactamase superfamily II) [Paenibacillus wynnii]